MIARLIHRLTDALAHPAAIVGVPLGCWVAYHFLSETALTLALSIIAISATQLILFAANCGERAMHCKVDELIRAIEAADDTLIGLEQKDE